MANIPPIQFKRSHDAGAQPTPNQLAVGELAINMADATLWTKDSDGNVISLGGGSVAGAGDSDIVFVLDSDGNQTGTEGGNYDINILTVERDGNSWQNNTAVKKAPDGARINVFRKRGETKLWGIQTDTGTRNGWEPTDDSVGYMSGQGIAILSYNGVNSYAGCNDVYSSTFRLQLAYNENADHASLAARDHYVIFQYFPVPVAIGNGTALGQFENGRSLAEHFPRVRVEFYDTNCDLITAQTFTGLTNNVTNTINVTGNITGVRHVIFRGEGSNSNTGLNDINLYVNGSTAFPTATNWGSDEKWAFAWKNVGNITNPPGDDEVMLIYHVSTVGARLSGSAAGSFKTAQDWCTDGNADASPFHMWWLNKKWAVAGGTFINGRLSFSSNHHNAADLTYWTSDSDGDNTEVFQQFYQYRPTGYQTLEWPACRNVSRITMETSEINSAHGGCPSRNYIGLAIPTAETSIEIIDQAEIWVKNTNLPSDEYFVDGYRKDFTLFTKTSN